MSHSYSDGKTLNHSATPRFERVLAERDNRSKGLSRRNLLKAGVASAVAGSLPFSLKRGNIKGDAFGSPDGLWFDDGGILWIQTDVSTSAMHRGDYEFMGNNQMLAADIKTGEVRRFLTGPSGCEVTGVVTTPDGRTMFVNIQHPGETSTERSDPKTPKVVSAWPDGAAGGRPRSATLVIRKNDGGVIGT